jgi:hypothetical protein
MTDQFKLKKMYYNRKLTDSFSALIEPGGALRWLFDFVKNRPDLDFQIGKNKTPEWISVYRGTTRIIKIQKTNDPGRIVVEGALKYKTIYPILYGPKSISINFQKELEEFLYLINADRTLARYYNNEKEGFYQTALSRKYGLCGCPTDDFVIIDKEAVVGYLDKKEKAKLFGPFQQKYKIMQRDISDFNSEKFGQNLEKKAVGNELDFLALDKEGNILLIEYKHGTNTSGIYLSPLQIGLYYDIFTGLPKTELSKAVFEMLAQKQKIGLINPGWVKPAVIKDIIPVLIISNYNYKSSAKGKFEEIMDFLRPRLNPEFLKTLQTSNFTLQSDLLSW